MLELSALNHLDDLIQLFITQYHSLKIKTRMSKGLWDLIQVALGSLNDKPELRSELELLLKPGNGSSGSSHQSPQEVITLSPMSESNSLETPKSSVNGEIEMAIMTKLGIQLDEVISAASLPRYFNSASTLLLESCKRQNTDDSELRMSVRVLQQLRDVDLHVFDDIFTTWLRDQVEPALLYNMNAFTKLLIFCVIYECVSMEKIADIFMQLKSVRLPGSTVNSKLMMTVISSQDLSSLSLKPSEDLLLEVHRRSFERSNPSIYLRYIVEEIINSPTSETYDEWSTAVTDFLVWLSTNDFDLFMSGFVDPIVEKRDPAILSFLRNIVNKLLNFVPQSTDNHTDEQPSELSNQDASDSVENRYEHDILNIVTICNDFNVALCQVQAKVTLELLRLEDVESRSESEISPQFIETASRLFLSCACKGINLRVPKTVFGDLIVHLHKAIKGEVLYQCEVKFLKSSQFPIVQNDAAEGKKNIVGVLLEIVDSVSDSCTKDICSSHIFDIEKCLEKLVSVCEESEVEGTAMKVVDVTPPAAVPVPPLDRSASKSEGSLGSDGMAVDGGEVVPNTELDGETPVAPATSATIPSTASPEVVHYSKSDIHDAVILFVKILMIHFHNTSNQSQQGNLLRDKIIHGFSVLHDTSVIKSLPDLSGLLLDALNAIREDFSTNIRPQPRSGTAALSPLASRISQAGSSIATPSGQPSLYSNVVTGASAANPMSSPGSRFYLSDLVVFDKASETYSELKVRSFDLLEEGNPVMSVNDAPLNLAMFDSATERNNPA
ncbi:Mediator of RNA polymerase II transcription subunit 12 [Sugiyamaella lignohabitans]|uniref:Mediator of RNA polymerase II transcription subunit 12 n=1 Tax=Sugiyamaella lignohabitans TaxID=796027 RepID=A0A161HLA5_9ASCO|nr:Mediator of RNA polymerase II transcription subunit 12 [Sugiyamaella lignohabitans]ANB12808.1 Mediator of RNA polymerase II transcription subunit 12 [Sugiyamaella lignohabitans]